MGHCYVNIWKAPHAIVSHLQCYSSLNKANTIVWKVKSKIKRRVCYILLVILAAHLHSLGIKYD